MVEISWRMSTACWAAACLSVSAGMAVMVTVMRLLLD
jgi:hypothetical protein